MTGCALVLFVGLIAGYFIGTRLAKRRRRELQQALNTQSLELLDVRSEHRDLSRFMGAAQRKDRLLKLTLKKLQASNQAVQALQKLQQESEREHFIAMSRLNVSAVESKQQAKRAASAAQEANFRLRLLERALPDLQTITTHEPKSYGQGEAVTVRVVDKLKPAVRQDMANPVSHRDLHRLASMEPVNEQVRERPDNTVTFTPNTSSSDQKPTSKPTNDQSLHKKGSG